MDYGTDMMLRKVDAMRKNGYDEETIAKFFGLSKIELRKHISMRNRDNRIVLCSLAKELKEKGKSVREIAIGLWRFTIFPTKSRIFLRISSGSLRNRIAQSQRCYSRVTIN